MSNLPQTQQLDASAKQAELRRLAVAAGFTDPAFLDQICRHPAPNDQSHVLRFSRINDREWQAISAHLPPNVLAARGAPPRDVVDALLWRSRFSSSRWRGLPAEFGDADLLRQRAARWARAGVLKGLFSVLGSLHVSPERRSELAALARVFGAAEAKLMAREAVRDLRSTRPRCRNHRMN